MERGIPSTGQRAPNAAIESAISNLLKSHRAAAVGEVGYTQKRAFGRRP
jgi:hypothetical protein